MTGLLSGGWMSRIVELGVGRFAEGRGSELLSRVGAKLLSRGWSSVVEWGNC